MESCHQVCIFKPQKCPVNCIADHEQHHGRPSRWCLLFVAVALEVLTRMSLTEAARVALLGQTAADRTSRKLSDFSPNNRGASLLTDPRAWAFGERREDTAEATTWSQPDPRRRYSVPIGPIGELYTGRSGNSGLSRSQSKLEASWLRSSSRRLDQLKRQTAEDAQDLTNTVDDRKLNAGNVVTLIKYVPMLFSVPADQLNYMSASALRSHPYAGRMIVARPPEEQKLGNSDVDGLYGAPADTGGHLGSDLGAHSHPASAYVLQQDGPGIPVTSAKLTYLTSPVHPGQHMAGHSTAGATSKALTAYANRLMAMLRPSTLLASMSPTPSAPQSSSQFYSGLTGAGPIYLIAPASVGEQVNQRPSQYPVSSEMLLNQASKMHLQSAAKTVGRPSWPGTNPGLVCMQSPTRSAQTGGDVFPVSQSTSSTTESGIDLSSFDYVTGGLESGSTKQASVGSRSRARESPVKVAHKLGKKLVKIGELEQKKAGGEEEQSSEQQSASDSSTRRTNSYLADSRSAPNSTSARWSSRANSTATSVIPFTIRDKIELRPAANSNPVEFDEPEDSPSESLTGSHQSGPRWLDERPNPQTSFISGRRSTPKPQVVHEYINYRKETASDQHMPMLMASSSSGQFRSPSPSTSTIAGDLTVASSSVTTSSTLDGQPVELASGELARQPEPTRMVLVSSVNAAKSANSVAPRAHSNKTVEVLVNSTPVLEVASSTTTSLPSVKPKSASPADNHQGQLESSNRFSNNKLLTTGDEFARISEALQTDPLDLIDLQNSRSNFELPSQLESLSMLHHQYEPALQPQTRANPSSRYRQTGSKQ